MLRAHDTTASKYIPSNRISPTELHYRLKTEIKRTKRTYMDRKKLGASLTTSRRQIADGGFHNNTRHIPSSSTTGKRGTTTPESCHTCRHNRYRRHLHPSRHVRRRMASRVGFEMALPAFTASTLLANFSTMRETCILFTHNLTPTSFTLDGVR